MERLCPDWRGISSVAPAASADLVKLSEEFVCIHTMPGRRPGAILTFYAGFLGMQCFAAKLSGWSVSPLAFVEFMVRKAGRRSLELTHNLGYGGLRLGERLRPYRSQFPDATGGFT